MSISSSLPASSDQTPLLEIYITLSMIYIAIAIIGQSMVFLSLKAMQRSNKPKASSTFDSISLFILSTCRNLVFSNVCPNVVVSKMIRNCQPKGQILSIWNNLKSTNCTTTIIKQQQQITPISTRK